MQSQLSTSEVPPMSTNVNSSPTTGVPAAEVVTAVDSAIANKYKKMSQREHVLTLPDSYIGSAESSLDTIPVIDTTTGLKIKDHTALYNRGLYKIIDELLVNAWDQKVRTDGENAKIQKSKMAKAKKAAAMLKTVTKIDISIDTNTTEISVRNDGEGIDIAMHPEHNVYTVELIFGHLLTSTNYHKGDKLTGGKNGFGAKLANVFAKRFEVETVDRHTKQKYTQVFSENMSSKDTPTIVPYDGEPYTQVKVIPDLARFGMSSGWTESMVRLIEKRAYDIAACAGKDVAVTYNGNTIQVNDMGSYMKLFDEGNDGCFSQVINERWEVGVALSDDGFKQQSFVNGVWTIKGGKHVDYVANQISKHVCAFIEKKKKVTVKPMYVKENLMLFVKAMIVNPAFDGQTKETLTTPSSKFGSKCELPVEFIDKVHKLGLIDRVVELYQFKEMAKAKKDEGKKRGRISGIPKLDDANKAGGKEAHKCTLILTEGDSAKAMAIAGLSVIGRDYYGVFPLRGKMINARDKMTTVRGMDQMNANEEMCNMKRILGLEQGKAYKTEEDIAKHLRYGKVMIMTDQDVDGSHIKGLFMNWIDSQWPELMELNFVTAMNTPIIKAKKGTKERKFYSIGQCEEWRETAEGKQAGWNIKYYKGLGTSTTKEAKEYFEDLKLVNYFPDEENKCKSLDLAFAKDRADDRKEWMANYNIKNTLDSSLTDVSYTEFVDKEFKHFSIYDTQRSIGNVVDGLKPSQRKILYACFKRKLTKEIKVAQLAGYVSENTGYHHGEQSLNDAIVGMAQTFVGSNNMNLLMPNGQFGTRLQGGKDAASPRYIFTMLNQLTQLLFHPDDQPLLEYLDDDGQKVEPRFYVPILPVALMNGVHGVGTGYSTAVPMYDPIEVCDVFLARLKLLLKAQAKAVKPTIPSAQSVADAATSITSTTFTPFPDLHPSYNGFTGKIIQLNNQSYLTKGKYWIKDYKTVVVHELPIGTWTDDYKEFLETLLVDYTPTKKKSKSASSNATASSATNKRKHDGVLKHYTSHCTESSVHFELEFKPEVLQKWNKTACDVPHVDSFEKHLRLTSKVSLTNMHLFDSLSCIKKYITVSSIMEAFYGVRLDYYERRRAHQLGVLQHELDVLKYKVKFIDDVIADRITVAKQTKTQLSETLEKCGFPMFAIGDNQKTPSYNYLVTMPIYSLTTDTLDKLRKSREETATALAKLENTTAEAMWVEDLKIFRKAAVSAREADAKAAGKGATQQKKKNTGGTGNKKTKASTKK